MVLYFPATVFPWLISKVHRHAVLDGSVGVVAELSEGLPQPRTQSIHAVWHVALRHESML